MNIEKIKEYAREKGIPEKRIPLLINELHPDPDGKVSLEEYTEAVAAVNFVVHTKEYAQYFTDAVRASREQYKNRYGKQE